MVLKKEEKAVFALFVGFSITRVPSFRRISEELMAKVLTESCIESLLNPDEARAFHEEFEKKKGRKIDYSCEELARDLVEGRMGITARPEASLAEMPNGRYFALSLFRMKWAFWEAPQGVRFLTSDNPVAFSDPSNANKRPLAPWSLENKRMVVTFPVTRDFAFYAHWGTQEGFYVSTPYFARDINRRTVICASRFVYASERSDAISCLVQKYKDSAPRFTAPGN